VSAAMAGGTMTVNIDQADWDALKWRIELLESGSHTIVGGPHAGLPAWLTTTLDKMASGPVDIAALSTAILNGLDYHRLAAAIAAQMTQRPMSITLTGSMSGSATPQGS